MRVRVLWLIMLVYGCCDCDKYIQQRDELIQENQDLSEIIGSIQTQYNMLVLVNEQNMHHAQFIDSLYKDLFFKCDSNYHRYLYLDSLCRVEIEYWKNQVDTIIYTGMNNQVILDTCNCPNADSLLKDFIENFTR